MDTEKRTALVIGATGLVGTQLLQQLLTDERFGRVIVFVRRSTGIGHHKFTEHIIDFIKPDTWEHLVKGDTLFSTLGTTIKQAGSSSAQYKIDYTYQYAFAVAASKNHVPNYVLVSAVSSSPTSRLFYSRMKGELERDIKKLPFLSVHILQPGLLAGYRKETRGKEKLAIGAANLLNSLGLFKSYRPIQAEVMARAMIRASFKPSSKPQTWVLDEIFALAESN